MKLLGILGLAAGALASAAFAHDPITTNLTWSKEISRVVYQHCASCHRPQGRAMALLTYEEARPWAKAIRDEVLNRRMPPWGAVKGVGEFREDPSLSQTEMDLLVNWVEGGAPEGDPAYLPTVPPIPETHAEPSAKGIEWTGTVTLSEPLTVAAITPSGATEVVVMLPDRSVKRLLWVRDFRAEWNRAFVLRNPVRLPKGTRAMVYGAKVLVR